MVFSRATEYAIRAMTFLAGQPPGKLTGAREISQAEHIPMPFLWKILQILARRRLVRSFKGLRGGYELAQPAEKINLLAVVSATDGEELTDRCVLGLPECSEKDPCPLHETWKGVRGQLTAMLEETTVQDLSRMAQTPGRRKRK